MYGYKNFAVVGAGNLGKFILNAFAAKFAEGAISSVTLLTRSVRTQIRGEFYYNVWSSY